VHRIALIDGPNMSNLGHRSKKVYGPNQPSIDGLHKYVDLLRPEELYLPPHVPRTRSPAPKLMGSGLRRRQLASR
jgi:hypothetical protein